MAIDFDALKKKYGYSQPVKAQSVVPTQTQAQAQAKIPLSTIPASTTRTVQTPRGEKTVINNDRIKYADTTTEGIGQAMRDNAGARFIAGYYEGLSPVSMQDAIGQKYGQDTQEALQNSKAYAGGQMAGVATQFAIPYAGAAPKIGTALSGVSKFANMGKVGQGITKSVATDLAVGLPLNVNYALNKEGLTGTDALKSIGINTAIDLVAGGILEAVPVILKSGKRIASKDEFLTLSAPEQQEVLLSLPAPNQETKLLTEGINWVPGTQPIRELPEPRMYVDEKGNASFTPGNERPKEQQTESIFTNGRTEIVSNPKTEENELFDSLEIDVFNDNDMNLVNQIVSLYPGKDVKAILNAYVKNVDEELESIYKDIEKEFINYKPKGVDLIPNNDPYNQHNMIRVSNNDRWYSDFYKSKKRAPNKTERAEIAREFVDYELRTGGGYYVDPKFVEDYKFAQQASKISDVLGDNVGGVSKNADGTYSFSYGDKVNIIKPDYQSAKGKVETPFIATQNELSFTPKVQNRASTKNGIIPTRATTPTKVADEVVEAMPKQTDTTTPQDVAPNAPNRPAEPRNVDLGTTGQNEQMFAETGDFTIGADKTKPLSTTEELIAKNGAFEPGMNPRARDTQVPKQSDIGKVQQATRTMVESKIVDDTLVNDILDGVREGSFTLFTKSNVDSITGANNKIADGIDSAFDSFASVLKTGKQANSEDIALGARLLQEYQKAGDYAKAMDVAIDLSEMLSETGRTLQASQIIKKLTPEGRLLQVQRTAKRLSDKFGKDVKVSDETAGQIAKAKTDAEIYKANEKAFTEMWNQIPADITNKINAWRYMSMLINPKTHIRNIVGNAIFLPAREFKNAIGAGLEKAIVPVGQRTKAILTPKDKGLISFANKDFANVVDILRGETKFVEDMRNQQADVFKTKVLEGLRKFGLNALNEEDTWFLRLAYDSSLAQYMKANKLTEADMVGEVLDKARMYALQEAEKATYRDASKLASAISKTKANLAEGKAKTAAGSLVKKAGEVALEGAIPFAKTPINILRRGFEYSPASLVTGLVDITRGVKTGKVTAAEAIDTLSAGLSGTALVGLGAWLAHHGIVNGGSTDPYGTKEYNSQTMQGMQEYSLNVGDGTYTIDWAAPLSLPFFVGVEVMNMLDKESGNTEDTFIKLMDSLTTVSDPLFNLSMLQGINNALNTWGGNENVLGGAVGEIFKNTAMSYFGQFVPTFFGQIARTVDDTRRTTTSTDENMLKRQVEKFINQQKAKIPVANKKLEPYIDVWGRTEGNGTAFGNFFNPGYYKETNVTNVDSELNDLYGRLDEESRGDVLPRDTTRYTITEKGVDYRMSEKELTQFKKTRGQTAYTELSKLFVKTSYKQMDDADKAKAIKKVYDDAFEKAKQEFLKKRSSVPIKN